MRTFSSWAGRPKDERWLFVGTMGFVVALAALAMWFSRVDDSRFAPVKAGSDIRVSRTDLDPGDLRSFSYPVDNSTSVGVIVQRGDEKTIRVAFAVCRRCVGVREYIRMGRLICGHCGHAMPLPAPDHVLGADEGCVPAPIPFSTEGSDILVSGKRIEAEYRRWYQRVASDRPE